MSRNTLRAIAVAGAIAISLTGTARANANGASVCSPTWDYPLDTWRLHPDSLDVNGSIVVVNWHIDDVYIPDSPDASSDLETKVSIQIDAGPIVAEEIFQGANVKTKRQTQISNLINGHHTITVSMNGGYFTACVEIPSHGTVVHWYRSDEPIPVH